MNKKVVVISTSLRAGSNSDALARAFAKGAEDAGNEVEVISLRGRRLAFCTGCMACQTTGCCVIQDDATQIAEKVLHADAVAFATPIYYYEMSGQMKTLLDRMNSLYPKDYRFRAIYLLTAAAEDEAYVPERAVSGLQGWIDCFERAALAGTVFCGGVEAPEDIAGSVRLEEARQMGKRV